MSNESKELAAKAKSFDSKKAFDLLLNNALYILMIFAVIVIQIIQRVGRKGQKLRLQKGVRSAAE